MITTRENGTVLRTALIMFIYYAVLLVTLLLIVAINSNKGEQLLVFNNTTFTVSTNLYKKEDRVIFSNTLNDATLQLHCRYIECSRQNIPFLSTNSVGNLSFVKRIILDAINTSEIAENAFNNLPKLKVLKITNNPHLQQLPGNAFNCSRLFVLDLSGNGLEILLSLQGVPKLRQLVLNGNRLRTITPQLFSNTPHLYDVHFSSNRLKEIPEGAFKYMNTADVKINIFLDGNEISEFNVLAFHTSAKIDSLMVNGNELENFDVLRNVESVDWLELTGNDIQCLDFEIVMRKVKVLMADANPWNCDCLLNFTDQGTFYANAELARCLLDE